MASPVLTKREQNVIRCVKICVDVLHLPLTDILESEIQPVDLYNKIQHSSLLSNGKNRLSSPQMAICFLSPPTIPNYSDFDVTLLYKLIRNLCPSLEPTKGWGKDPVDTDTQIGDDIERLRFFRSKIVHNVSSNISDNDFEMILKELKSVLQRIQNHMTSKGYNVNYEEKMTNVKQLDLHTMYKHILENALHSLKQADDNEEPIVSIEGPRNVLCGNTATFIVVTYPENLKGWSLTWHKLLKCTQMRINSNTEKYYGSTEKNLAIQSVCKEDEGGYQVILSKDSKANTSVSSNVIFLQAIKGLPVLDVWNVTTNMTEITIHYAVKERPPQVNEIKWCKDGVRILNKSRKYNGGNLNDNCFTIISPTIEDRGDYSCVVTNAVGSVQKDVRIDVPNAEISTKQQTYIGSETIFTAKIVSCPSPLGVQWQQSNDGTTFNFIDVSKPKYYGSIGDPMSPLLKIPKVTFEDKLYYRLRVWNTIGDQYSNTVFLDVKGLPVLDVWNVTTNMTEITIHYAVKERPPQVNEIKWFKDGVRILNKSRKYNEGNLNDNYFTINSPTIEDRGNYSCVVTNPVGSVQKDVRFDVPYAEISTKQQTYIGSKTIFTTMIVSCPSPDGVDWQQSNDGKTFESIIISKPNYLGSSRDLKSPLLIIPKVTFEDKLYYRLLVWNTIGEQYSNTVFLDVKDETSERTPTEKELASVSKHIGAEFYILGVQLGLRSATIEQIMITYRHSVQTQILKILLSWKNKNGTQATVGKLLQAVKSHSNDVDSLEIERIFQCDKNDGFKNH